MIRKSKALLLAAVFAVLLAVSGCGDKKPSLAPDINAAYTPYDESLRVEDTRGLSPYDYSVFNTTATDDFSRTFVTVDGKDDTKYVGMFYFIGIGHFKESTGLYDVSVITQNGKNNDAFQVNDETSPYNAIHFWGEPVYGYYDSEDEWVLRKHIELLTMAGIDFLVFDVSNAITYKSTTDVLFPILQEYYDKGWDVPKFMYYTAHDGGGGENKRTITELYNNYYKDGKYRDLWFCPYDDGKPLITRHQVTTFADGDPIGDFFHFRYRQWPNESFDEEGTPWIEFTYPQPVHTGWMNVAVATHCKTLKMSDGKSNPGRGATWFGEGATAYFVNDSEHYREGAHFEQQWDTLIGKKDEVDFAFVTGWNEWGAIKQRDGDGKYFTADLYNAEFSRDLEPTRTDGLGDNFYLQNTRKMRAYNGIEAKHYTYPAVTPSLTSADAWQDTPTYMDFTNDCLDRNGKAAILGSTRRPYKNTTGRNDIESIQVAHDAENVYFRITATEDITAPDAEDTSWMNIWISTANGAGKKLHGYNYVINRNVSGNKTEICRTFAAGDIRACGEGEVYVYGNTVLVKAPLSVMGLSGNDYTFSFKVTDNVSFENDYMDLYDTGDSAPCGRLNFSYGY